MAKEESKLSKLKKDYSKIQKKHSLPSFDELNRDFQIEKLSEIETDFLTREIRKVVGDKIVNYMRFIESLLNPVNVPMFVFTIIKAISPEDKKKLSEIYKVMIQNEIKFIKSDIEFSEERDVKFILDSYEFWNKTKKDLFKILEKVESNWDKKIETNSKGYFG